jgi:RNA polymerase sigma factor (sigma-70 family)
VCSLCAGELARDLAGAFPTAVAHHQDLVYGIARRSTGDPSDAEDLAQEAFLRAYRALAGYETSRIADLHLRGWLARITLNLARNQARDRGPGMVDVESVPEPVDVRQPDPEVVAERREAARMWRRLLDGLPAAYRAAIELRHVDGLPYHELAEALGKPIGTVKSDVHRGVRLLRKAYEAELEATRGSDGMNAGRTTGSDDGVRAGGRETKGLAAPEVMIR